MVVDKAAVDKTAVGISVETLGKLPSGPVDNRAKPCVNHTDVTIPAQSVAESKTVPVGAATTVRDLTTTSTARRHVMAERQPTLTQLQQALQERIAAAEQAVSETEPHSGAWGYFRGYADALNSTLYELERGDG